MYCTNCGARLDDGDSFCTSCGTPAQRDIAHGTAAATGQFIQAPPPAAYEQGPEVAPSSNQGAKQKSPIFAAALLVAALCIAGFAAALSLGVMGPSGTSGRSEIPARAEQASPAGQATASASDNSPSAQETPDGDKGAEVQGEPGQKSGSGVSAGSAGETDRAAQSNEPKGSSLINLANKDDYYDLNIFLSNFSEWPAFYDQGKVFDRDHYDKEQLVNWGMWHNALNNDSALERGKYKLDGAPAASWSKEIGDAKPKSEYSRRMKKDLIEKSIARYIGLDFNLSGYDSGNGDYYERDGYVYEGLYRGNASPTGNVALSQSVEDVGSNMVLVEFNNYVSSLAVNQALSEKNWYGMTDAEISAAMKKASGREPQVKPGMAVVEVSQSGDPRFKLVAFAVDS